MDRLSGLPDDVIFCVLSFLPAKNSVRTSTLAKGWKFHWAHVPCFGFTNMQVMLPNLVNNFHIEIGTTNDEFDSWITTVFERNVRNLVIGLKHHLMLPRRLFTCKTLVYLRILDCGCIPNHKELGTVCFPALKKLELVNFECDSAYTLRHLLSGCPVLEELTIERMKALCCDVTSPSLTRLVIDVDEVEVLQIQNPSLRYLRLRDRMSKGIAAKASTSLIEADVDLMYEGNFFYSHSVKEFVGKLYNVKCLKLSTRRMNIDDSYFSDLNVKFHNLTELNLCADWRFITTLVKNSNNLRVLTIRRMVDHTTQYWMEPKQVPECLISHLETVNLVDFGWSADHEFDMVKYILKNAKVLKNMEIVCTQNYKLDSNVKRRAINIIAVFEIGSPTCQLSFVSFV